MLSPEQLVLWVSATALQLARGSKSTEELAVLGSALTQLGDTIATMAAQQEAIENAKGQGSS